MVVLHSCPVAAAGLFAFLAATPTPCQVPDGWFVTSHAYFSSIPGPGGLWLHHPRTPGNSIQVTRLPAALTGVASSSGSGCVILLPDGRLVVGTFAPNFGTVELHVVGLDVNLNVVPPTAVYNPTTSWSMVLGTVNSPFGVGGMLGMQLLSSTQVLIWGGGIANGPLAGAALATVDLSTRTVTPISVTGLPTAGWTRIEAAVRGDTAYVALLFWPARSSQLFRVSFQTGFPGVGNATLVATWPQLYVTEVEIEASGALLLGCGIVNGPGQLRLVDPSTGAILRSTQVTPSGPNFARETTTGGFAFAGGGAGSVYWGDGTRPATLLAGPPTSGWGAPTGVVVAPDPVAYGNPSPTWGNGPRWQLDPNPGGLPRADNMAFAVGIDRAMDGIWVANFAQASLPNWNGYGFDLLVSPNGGATIGVLNAGIVNLPLPAWVPMGTQLFLQTFHFTYAGPVASEGLRITTL